jgi:RsiW-degrading membrane proteinase PrsW (M82 family)
VLVAVDVFATEAKFAPGLFLPPALVAAAALPPLWAVSWFTRQQAEGLTWRRGLVAFSGGATVSVGIALALEILLPLIVLSLVFGLGGAIMPQARSLFTALAGKNIAAALTNPSFVYLFVQIAVIAPLAEEFAKPLVVLPFVGRLTRREAFLVSAMAGAGFAALENVLYAGFGLYLWAGILLARALGGAIHPLGAGLVGLAWRDILRGEPRAWTNGVARFGLAVGMHAAWNGGSLLVITLGGARFFGQLPPQINVLGLAAGGTTLAFLVVLGLAALWLGREVSRREDAGREDTRREDTRREDTRRDQAIGEAEAGSVEGQFILSDRAAAIWAFVCLVAVVPAGITSLQLLVR